MFNRPSSVLPPEIEKAALAEREPQQLGYAAEQNALKLRHEQEKFALEQAANKHGEYVPQLGDLIDAKKRHEIAMAQVAEKAKLKAQKLAEEERIGAIVPETEEAVRSHIQTLENEANDAYGLAKNEMEKTQVRSTKVKASDLKNIIDTERENAFTGATQAQGLEIIKYLDALESELFKHPQNAVELGKLLTTNKKMNKLLFDTNLPALLKDTVTNLRNGTAKILREHAARKNNVDTWGKHWLEGQDKWMEKSKLEKSIPERVKQSRIQVGKEKIKAKAALHEQETTLEKAHAEQKYQLEQEEVAKKQIEGSKVEEQKQLQAQKAHTLSQKQTQELFESKQREAESKRAYENRSELAKAVKEKGISIDDFSYSFWSPLHFALKNGQSFFKLIKEGLSSKSQNAALKMVQEQYPEIAEKYKRAGQLYDHGKPAELISLVPVLNVIVQENERSKRK
jgi:hypothetical protein